MMDIENNLSQILNEVNNDLENIKNLEELKQLRAKYIKLEILNQVKKQLKETQDLDEKKHLGKILSNFNQSLNLAFSTKQNELENSFFLIEKENELIEGTFDLEKVKDPLRFCYHPLTLLGNKVKEFFEQQLNYEFKFGNEVEDEEYNFDILNIPKNHTARSMHDSLYFRNNKMLRTHSTNITARKLLESNSNENFFYSIGSVFRNDDNDATHSFQFNQVDFFATSEKKVVSISNLKSVLDALLKYIFETELETRYRISYFPFTEPSFEVDVKFLSSSEDKQDKWIEVLGSGMINDAVLYNTKKNPSIVNGFAGGVGLERLAMLKWNIDDIRHFYTNHTFFIKKLNRRGEH